MDSNAFVNDRCDNLGEVGGPRHRLAHFLTENSWNTLSISRFPSVCWPLLTSTRMDGAARQYLLLRSNPREVPVNPSARTPANSMATSVATAPCVAFDDPVPSDSVILGDTVLTPGSARPHSVERQVQRKLLSQTHLQFSSLVVRRLPDGVCIEGVLDSTDGADVSSLALQVAGVQRVVNRLLIRSAEASC